MRRRLKLQTRASRAAFDEVCRTAGIAFQDLRFQDALAMYEQFAQDHPEAHAEEIELRIGALKSYIVDHVEELTN